MSGVYEFKSLSGNGDTMTRKTQRDETIANAISLEILNSSFQFPPMPANGRKLMQLVQQPIDKIDVGELVRLVEPDPGLYTMVLQLANSVYFKGVEEVISLRSAIGRVGLNEAIESVNFYFFRRMLPKVPEIEGFSAKNYWAFSWACAIGARCLGHPNLGFNVLPGQLYIAGLLHGIGKLALAINHTDTFSDCIIRARKMNQPLHVIELEEFGTTDALVASKLMGVWNIPPSIIQGIVHYQDPGSAPDESRDIAALIQYAYCIAAASGIGTNGDGEDMSLEDAWIMRHLGSPLREKEIREKVTPEIFGILREKSESVTGVGPKGDQTGKPGPKTGIKRARRSHEPAKKGLFSRFKSFFR